MAWYYLAIAGLLEIIWAVAFKYNDPKYTEGLRRVGLGVFTVAAMIGSFYFLWLAMRTLPLGTAYAIWTGIGALGTAIVGIVWLGESASPVRLACLALVLFGIMGLKLTSAG